MSSKARRTSGDDVEQFPWQTADASAVALAWEGGRIHEMRGDARRLLLSRMVIDHRVSPSDPFQLTESAAQRTITGHLLGDRVVGMAEVGELLSAA